ncbi:MAG: DUF421 domain-containing protein [Candidatus Sericytochromatia bacterium]
MNEISEVVIRSVIVYFTIIIGLRLIGRQHLGQISINDFVLVLLISNAVQNAMVGNNTSLIGGIVSALTLLLISYLISNLIYSSPNLRKILNGEQIILIHDGLYQEENLKKVKITHDELESIIREHGATSVKDVHSAILETDGSISIINNTENNNKPSIQKHHRRK